MAGAVIGLHLLGFFILVVLVAPHHYNLGPSGGFTIGLGLTAYTLGLRHALDADHISAIDNTTRKLWHWVENINLNALGFVIAGMFVLTGHVRSHLGRRPGRVALRADRRAMDPEADCV
jgi:high-affinity nickel permease